MGRSEQILSMYSTGCYHVGQRSRTTSPAHPLSRTEKLLLIIANYDKMP